MNMFQKNPKTYTQLKKFSEAILKKKYNNSISSIMYFILIYHVTIHNINIITNTNIYNCFECDSSNFVCRQINVSNF